MLEREGTRLDKRPYLVHRTAADVIPACGFREPHLKNGTKLYVAEGLRAAYDAKVAGWTARFAWPLGVLLTLVGFALARAARGDLRRG